MLTGVTPPADPDWFVEHATLIVGVVGILVSGLLGPTITSLWTTKRESDKEQRSRILARRDDLRNVLDEAAILLGSAISQLRPAVEAQRSGEPLPEGPADFLRSLNPMGQRLRLRLPVNHPVIKAFDDAREALTEVSKATASGADWQAATATFNDCRSTFLEAGRQAVEAPIVLKDVK